MARHSMSTRIACSLFTESAIVASILCVGVDNPCPLLVHINETTVSYTKQLRSTGIEESWPILPEVQ